MAIFIPPETDTYTLRCGEQNVALSNLNKVFWPELGKTKRDLLNYYAAVAPVLIPHLKDRAMVMKRYPNGIEGKFFFMKRTPEHRPAWLGTCSIEHGSGSVIDFPVIDSTAALMWLVNLGCIDLNPWYSRCDDVNRPDILNFDLDPVTPADFARLRDAAFLVKAHLDALHLISYPKTTGSRGIHIYVPIQRGPLQKQVWTVAKRIAFELAERHPALITAEYRIAKRPAGRVLVDYNQNAWGRTLASVYSVRPKPEATVSAPITWDEIAAGIELSDLTMETVPQRIERRGDLFHPLVLEHERCSLDALL